MIYLNGRFLPIEEACVSVLDRGFIFGDGVYEAIPVYSGRPFRLADHLARLQHSLDGIRLANPHDAAGWEAILGELVARNQDGAQDHYLYLHITRGVAPRDHAFPRNVTPTVFAMCAPMPPAEDAWRTHGVAVVSAVDNRWLRCDIKTISLLPNVLLRQYGADKGALETLLLRDGFLTEGVASSIFVVREGFLLAPPKSHLVLPGITHDVILELAQRHGVPHAIREISEFEVRSADELWLASSTRELLPITTLDGMPVGTGRPGPVYGRLDALYRDYKKSVMRGGA